MTIPHFNKGDIIERQGTFAEVTGPVTPHGAVTVLIDGERKIVYASQWRLKQAAPPRRPRGRPPKQPGSPSRHKRNRILPDTNGWFFIQRATDTGWINETDGNNKPRDYNRFKIAWNQLVKLCSEYPGVAFRLVNSRGEEVTVPMAIAPAKSAICPHCGAPLGEA